MTMGRFSLMHFFYKSQDAMTPEMKLARHTFFSLTRARGGCGETHGAQRH